MTTPIYDGLVCEQYESECKEPHALTWVLAVGWVLFLVGLVGAAVATALHGAWGWFLVCDAAVFVALIAGEARYSNQVSDGDL